MPENKLDFWEQATIYTRLAQILRELPAIGKDERNEQQKFMYRGYDAVLNALNPLMGKYGVFLVPDVIERVTGERVTRSGNAMYEVNLHVRYRFYGLKGDYVEASGWGEGTDTADKATNKAMTMALKYVLFQVFAISTAETVDSDAYTPEESTRASAASGTAGAVSGGAPAPAAAEPQSVKADLVATDPQRKKIAGMAANPHIQMGDDSRTGLLQASEDPNLTRQKATELIDWLIAREREGVPA